MNMKKNLIKLAFLAALGEWVYIFLVAFFMLNAEKWFGNMPGIAGVASLLLVFVISAAISGFLILGKPILMYFEGKKKDATMLFFITVGWLLVFLAVLLFVMSLVGV